MIRRSAYRIGSARLTVETRDRWSAAAIDALFAGWYLSREAESEHRDEPMLVVRSQGTPPHVPEGLPTFPVAGGGTCHDGASATYIAIEGAVVAVGATGLAPVEAWTPGALPLDSPSLTRIVTYALSAALRRCGAFELHSGALVIPGTDRGVLIAGPSGSGKSTLTVHLAAAGWPFLSDDVVVLESVARMVVASPLRRDFAVTATTRGANAMLRTHVAFDDPEEPDAKRLFRPHDVFPAFTDCCRPGTLLFPRLTGERQSEVVPLTPAAAMARLLRISPWACYDRVTAAEHLTTLSSLAAQARSYDLLAGTDLLDIQAATRLAARVCGCD